MYPIRLSPKYTTKPWAGDRLRGMFPGLDDAGAMPPDTGEVAVVVDLPGESSMVQNGPWRELGLTELMRDHRAALLGELAGVNELPDFPVCVKFLDTRQMLSVQNHPSDRREGGVLKARGKSECWIVLAADPGAVVYQGLREGIKPAEFEAALDAPDGPVSLLNAREVKPGDFLYNPAGMIHAIGGGLTLLEVQQNCGVTWRLWDPPRDGVARETQREQGMADARFDLPLPKIRDTDGDVVLAPTGPFGVRALRITRAFQERVSWPGFTLHTCIEGGCEITARVGDNLQPAVLEAGETVLWPAGSETFEYYPRGECRIIQSWARE